MQQDSYQQEVEMQRQYYERTAAEYDEMHLAANFEHDFAAAWLTGLVTQYKIDSILDVGAGTGRLSRKFRQNNLTRDIKVTGIEPVKALREYGHANGIPKNELIDGDATNLNFPDNAFDLVCEFGILHHIRQPEKAVAEMLRVAKTAVFISDSNIYASGSFFERTAKQGLKALGLWEIAKLIKTGGKGYKISEGDGLWYLYSVYDNYQQIERACKSVFVMNTSEQGISLYRRCNHVALFGLKDDLNQRT